MPATRSFLPAAGIDAALPLFDPLTALFGGQKHRQVLIDRTELATAKRLLDIGCGTGTLAIAIKRAYPQLEVDGLDPDPRALTLARRKAERAGVEVRFAEGFGDALPYAPDSFDRISSSFMFHHLEPAVQRRLLGEALRVLSPEGTFHLVDFARPEGRRLFGLQLQAAEHVERQLGELGFVDARSEPQGRWLFHPVVYCSARRPGW